LNKIKKILKMNLNEEIQIDTPNKRISVF